MVRNPGTRPLQALRTRYLMALDSASLSFALAASLFATNGSFARTASIISEHWLLFPAALAVFVPLALALDLYSHRWRYATLQELSRILLGGTVALATVYTLNQFVAPFPRVPSFPFRSIFGLYWILTLGTLLLSRVVLRTSFEWLVRHRKQNLLSALAPRRHVLIAGAGKTGTMISLLIQEHPETGLTLIGFIDDEPIKRSKKIGEVRVLGGRGDIPTLVARHQIDEVILAMPSASQAAIAGIFELCAEAGVSCRAFPGISDLFSGTLTVDQLRQWRSPDELPQTGKRVQARAAPHEFRHILVTGGAGFIGSNLVRYLLDTHPAYKVVAFDKLTYAGNLDNLQGLAGQYGERFAFIHGDICEAEQVADAIRLHAIDAIVNLAAETHVDRSLLAPDHFLQTNVNGTYTLLEAARRFGIRRYHQVSTDEVYGQVLWGSFTEQDPFETRSPYSASKAAADLLVHSYWVSFGVPATITRGSNSIGPYQYPEKAVPLFITNALENLPLPVYGDGRYVRDYQFVLDHCRAIDFVLHRGELGQVYNIGGSNEITSLDLARKILVRLGKPHSLICLVEDRPGQDRRYRLNCAKIKALGWEPQWSFDEALDATIRWYLENEAWWRKIKDGEYKQYYELQFKWRLERALSATSALA